MHIHEIKEVIDGIQEVNSNVDSVRINTNEKLDKIISLLEKLVKQGE
ncbi:MAG: hypothetical protein ACREV6_01960 [Clostridium sp.]